MILPVAPALLDTDDGYVLYDTGLHPDGIEDPDNIEHSIRNALIAAYRTYGEEACCNTSFMELFGKRPTNKEFLLCLTREVYRRLWDESVEFARF